MIKLSVHFIVCAFVLIKLNSCQNINNDEKKTYTYYDNGHLSSVITLLDSMPVGDAFYYNSLGFLEEYHYFDVKHNLRYVCEFNSDQQIIKQSGKTIYLQIQRNKKKDSIYIYPTLIFPPKYLNKLEMYIQYSNSINLVFDKIYSKENSQPLYIHHEINDSITNFIFVSKLFNKDTFLISTDSVFYSK